MMFVLGMLAGILLVGIVVFILFMASNIRK